MIPKFGLLKKKTKLKEYAKENMVIFFLLLSSKISRKIREKRKDGFLCTIIM